MADKVKAKDTVTVYSTGKGKHMDKQRAHKVHKVVAEKLVSKGMASYSKQQKNGGKPDGGPGAV